MEPLRVFISHSSSDKAFCDALVRALRQAGADVWYDEHSLGVGHLLTELTEQVRTRPVFIVVLSKAALASDFVRDECQWAYTFYRRDKATRTILPVVAQPIEDRDFDDLVYLEGFRRVEGPGNKPYPQAEAIQRTLQLLATVGKSSERSEQKEGETNSTLHSLIALGKSHIEHGAYDEAITVLELVKTVAPGSFSVWFNLGLAHNELGFWTSAHESWERALRLKPNDGPALSNDGKALLGRREFEDALTAFSQALTENDHISLRWAGKGISLKYVKRYEEALEALERALALDTAYAEAWAAKANVLSLLQRGHESNVAFQRALDLNPHCPYPDAYKATSLRALRALGHETEAP